MAKAFNLSIHSKSKTLIVTKIDDDGLVVFENGQSISEHIILTSEQLEAFERLFVPDISLYETTD